MQILTYKFGSKIEDEEDCLNEYLELVRQYDEANGTDPVPDQISRKGKGKEKYGKGKKCKDNTSKDPFSQCENLQNLQGILIQVKSEYVGTLTTSEDMTRMQSDKHNNMFHVAANLKHANTHENIN